LNRLKPTVALAFAAALALGTSDAHAQRSGPQTFNVVPITVASVTPQDGQLVANLLVGSHLVAVPLNVSIAPEQNLVAQQQGICPILNLQLGPINLSLLGLNVDTSSICLKVTAEEGGGLLGDLLCSVANLLNQGIPLADVLAGLTTDQLNTLNYGLTQLLNQAVFIPLTSSDAVASATCSILHLELGPIDLNLLGLRVELDDCSGGPVVLDVTATEGGGLLGDLLCSLSNLLNNKSPNQTPPVLDLLQQVAAAIGSILG
jgi:hypothetical protein